MAQAGAAFGSPARGTDYPLKTVFRRKRDEAIEHGLTLSDACLEAERTMRLRAAEIHDKAILRALAWADEDVTYRSER